MARNAPLEIAQTSALRSPSRPRTRAAARAALAGAALTLAAAAVLAAPAATPAIELRDDRGATLTLPGPPRRIVSLLPSLTESVCALGACARVVGTDRFSNWPASVAALPKLGGIEDAEIEAVVALHPDVVLVSTSARVTARLESLGVKVIVLESKTHADVRRTLVLLGRMLGADAAALRLWADMDAATRAAAARVPPALRGKRVYFEVDPGPYAAGPGSFIGETLASLGLGNAIPAELGAFPKLNPEFVVRAQPDVIMASRPALADMPKRPGWGSLRALAQGQSCGFLGDRFELLVRPGPRMGEAASILVDCLTAIARGR